MPKSICSVPGCGRYHNARGYCHAHYYRWRKGDLRLDTPVRDKRPGNMSTVATFRYVMPEDPPLSDVCWPWRGTVDDRPTSGYGLISCNRAQHRAHRVAYEIFVGLIPDGLEICHHCDNPPCCNPRHLYAGTSDDNHRDMVLRDRSTRGERNAQAKLTQSQVDEIRRRYACEGIMQKQLAVEYGVSKATICNIIKRKVWRYGQLAL